jgi:predicted O-methyltransferase YrrM
MITQWTPAVGPESSYHGVSGFLEQGDMIYLAYRAAHVPTDGRIAEVGSYRGLSATIMATTNRRCIIFCVDTFDGPRDIPYRSTVYAEFRQNTAHLGNIWPIVGKSEHVVDRFPDNHFCFIFIDGDHSHNACLTDLRNWHPKLADRGLMAVHDCAPGSGVRSAIEEFGQPYHLIAPPKAHYIAEIYKEAPCAS